MARQQPGASADDAFDSTPDLEQDDAWAPRARAARHQTDDLDATERDGADVASASRLARYFDAEPDEAVEETTDDEISAAEATDLRSFAAAATLGDAFEEWVRIADRYPRAMTDAETDALLAVAHGDDADAAREAEDMLIRRSVRWIVKCIHKHAGREVMQAASSMRDDVLAMGRWGYLHAIRKYDHAKAHAGAGLRKKSLFGLGDIWIRKFVREYVDSQRYGMNADAANARFNALRARETLATKPEVLAQVRAGLAAAGGVVGRGAQPTVDEIAAYLEGQTRERILRDKKRKSGAPVTEKELRKRGALTVERITELLAVSPNNLSFDMASGDGEDGPTLGETLAEHERTTDSGLLRDEVQVGLEARVDLIADRRRRMLFRLDAGMRGESGRARPVPLNPQEMALIVGMTSDTREKHLRAVRQELAGEASVPVDQLTRRGFGFDPASIQQMSVIDPATRRAVREAVMLTQIVSDDRAAVARAAGRPTPAAVRPDVATRCPFEPENPNPVFVCDEDTFACQSCGRSGDVFAYVAATRQVPEAEAVYLVARLAVGVPSHVVTTEGGVERAVVTTNPAQRERLRGLQ